MPDTPPCWILSEGFAGLQAQALGLAEAAGFAPDLRVLRPGRPWSWFPARFWPNPTRVVASALVPPRPAVALGCGGMAAAVLAALRRPDHPVVQVQHPRMDPRRFDVVVANTHDELTGPNVIVSRTALHRVTPDRLAREAALWSDRLAPFKRPLVAVLLGGSNGRYRLDTGVAAGLARDLAALVRREDAGMVITPSRRTDPAVTALLRDALAPLGAWVWDFTGDNPYFAMLALADRIVVTQDSVSMISEAAATAAPVLVAPLPGRSRRQKLFLDLMLREGRVRMLDPDATPWPVAPLNDTPMVAAELRRRLSL
jgi:mitochondrial fission protein ELM1